MIDDLEDIILTVIRGSDELRHKGAALTGMSARVLTHIILREQAGRHGSSFGCIPLFEPADDVQALAAQQAVEVVLRRLVASSQLVPYEGLDDFGELAICYRESNVLEKLGGID